MSYDGIDPTKKPRLPKLFCNPTAAKNLREMNRIIAADISDQTDFKDLHAMIYAGAFAVLKLNGQRPTDVTSRNGTKRQPAWERRLSKNIDNIRSDIAILTQYQKPTYSQRVKKKGDTIMRRYTSEENPTIVEVLDLLKQRLLALSQRVKRYKKSSQRRKQNILFHRNQRAFYKSVGKESDRTLKGKTSFPNTEDIRHFWSAKRKYYAAMPANTTYAQVTASGSDNTTAKKFIQELIPDIAQIIDQQVKKAIDEVIKTSLSIYLPSTSSERRPMRRDQTIVKNGYLTQTETDELKREVGRAISQNAINDEVAPTRLSVLDQPHIEPECVTSQKQKELNDLFLSTLSFYRFSDPTKRPRLPKLLLNAKSNQIIHQMDEILLRHLEHCDDLEEVHLSIYAAAATVVNVNGQKLLPPNDASLKKTSKRSEEPWKLRLMKDIDSCRAEADLISEYQGGNRSRKVIKKIADIKRKINVPPSCDNDSSFLNLHRDKMRQEAKMKGARLQRYNETSKRKQQNALFERNQNQFYRSIISESSSEPKGIRDTQNFVKFWSDIWSEPKPSDLNAPWIKEVVKAAKKASNYWLTSGQMFPETEGFLVAIQDQVIPTNNYKRFILKNLQQSDKCRYGCQDSETIQHVTGGCQAFAPTDYKERHDIAAKIIHQELAYKFKLIECKLQYYKYTPQCVLENDKYKLYWDRTVLTDQYIKQNRPDIIIVDKGAQKVTLIDVAIPNSNNLTYKHNEKVAKYRELEFQIKRQWKMKGDIGILTQNQSLNPAAQSLRKPKPFLKGKKASKIQQQQKYWITLNKNSRLWLKNSDGIRKATQDVNTIVSLAGVKGAFIKI
ncbi:unnamed protein product [Acanthoscelides obtectus]|uniref:Uncharacterized protein n=1 Tax=Acanthoscelides obtectus TaxID=200917 RepID=A0A9P0QCD8_ACAOB|nr:unnamed protein product [Acanthoscelides obtectus]CAK1686883.1 hypothetical protein AOBTE_LOCUS36124 [Acanthoscelides obtectus]